MRELEQSELVKKIMLQYSKAIARGDLQLADALASALLQWNDRRVIYIADDGQDEP